MALGLKVQLLNKEAVRAEYISFVKELSDHKINLNIDSTQFKKITEDIKKINSDIGKLSNSINLKVGGVGEVNTQIKDLNNSINNLQQVKIKFVDGNAVQQTEKIKQNLSQVEQTVKNLKDGTIIKTQTTDITAPYKELNRLQQEEFSLRTQMIGKEANIRSELEKQLSIVRQKQQETGKVINDRGLTNEVEINSMLSQRAILQSNLKIKQEEINAREKARTSEIQKQIELYKQQANINIQNLQTRYGSLANNDILQGFRTQLNNITPENFNTRELNNSFRQLEANIRSSRDALRLTQREAESFGDSMTRNIEKFTQWYIIGNLISSIPRKFAEGVEFAKQFDSTLNSISIVTGKLDLSSLSNEFYELGKALSSTQKDISTSANEFFRQGLNESDVIDRLSTTTQFAKISNLQFKESAELLTASVNSLNVPIERATDVFSYLGRICPLV